MHPTMDHGYFYGIRAAYRRIAGLRLVGLPQRQRKRLLNWLFTGQAHRKTVSIRTA